MKYGGNVCADSVFLHVKKGDLTMTLLAKDGVLESVAVVREPNGQLMWDWKLPKKKKETKDEKNKRVKW